MADGQIATDRAAARPGGRPLWPNVLDVAARHPWVGAVAGLVLVGVLVPLLTIAGGYRGSLSPSIPLFFLVPVLIASTLGGGTAGVLVAVVATGAWDWFFIPPLYTPTITYPRDLLALVVFLFTALLTGQLATVVRQRADEATRRARISEALYDLSVALIASHPSVEVLPALTQRLRDTFALQGCAVLLPDERGANWHAAASSGAIPDELDGDRSRSVAGVLAWVATTGQVCTLGGPGRFAPQALDETHRSARQKAQFWPLRVGNRPIGVLELVYPPGIEIDAQRDRLLATLVNGVAIALEQQRLVQEEQSAAVARESDRLKSALLSSVSHDLRTPLAGIKAAASSLLQDDVEWSDEDRRTFISDIDGEADRLAHLVSNILDLSRIEAGALQPKQEWEDVGELVDRVVRRLRPRLPGHPVASEVPSGLPLARFDPVHIEQALTNLIENAARYSPDNSPIDISAELDGESGGQSELRMSVTDHGPGIPAAELSNIFDTFYLIAETGRRTGGTGMGLAIVKGLVEANGGRVAVRSSEGEGSTFSIILPVAAPDGAKSEPEDELRLELPAR